MIQCMVDGQEHDISAGEMDDLAVILDALSEYASKDGRFIASLKVDGCELDAGTEWYRPRKLLGYEKIEVVTGLTAQLASDALLQGEQQLDNLRGALQQTVTFFRSGNDQRGMKLFIDLINGFEWFISMIKSVGDIMQIDFTVTLVDGIPLSDEVDTMNRILLDIIGAQERRDLVLLGDLLEYELEPQLERWRKILEVLRRSGAV